jgi:hypothetical protein
MTTVQLLSPTGSVASRVPDCAPGIVLTEKQQLAVNQILEGKNVIVHGEAGTGKSLVIGAVLRALRHADVCSNTLAHYLQYNYQEHDPSKIISTRRLAQTRLIILDEYVMVSTEDMHNLDDTLRHYLARDKVFGGVQLVLVGDPFQLPPVSQDLFAESQLFRDFEVAPIVLDRLMRQDASDDGNDDLINFLSRLRTGTMDVHAACFLNYVLHKPTRAPFLGACATRKAAIAGNQSIVSKFDGPRYMLAKSVAAYEEGKLSSLLHIGAPVQLTKNIYDGDGLLYYNGQFGTCKAVYGAQELVHTDYGDYHHVKPKDAMVTVDIDGKEVGTRDVECAYYTTIHRLQGQTILSKLNVDLDGAPPDTVRQLAYVAFSRVKHFSQVSTSLTSFDMETW